jgi:hypothetical protein
MDSDISAVNPPLKRFTTKGFTYLEQYYRELINGSI